MVVTQTGELGIIYVVELDRASDPVNCVPIQATFTYGLASRSLADIIITPLQQSAAPLPQIDPAGLIFADLFVKIGLL